MGLPEGGGWVNLTTSTPPPPTSGGAFLVWSRGSNGPWTTHTHSPAVLRRPPATPFFLSSSSPWIEARVCYHGNSVIKQTWCSCPQWRLDRDNDQPTPISLNQYLKSNITVIAIICTFIVNPKFKSNYTSTKILYHPIRHKNPWNKPPGKSVCWNIQTFLKDSSVNTFIRL